MRPSALPLTLKSQASPRSSPPVFSLVVEIMRDITSPSRFSSVESGIISTIALVLAYYILLSCVMAVFFGLRLLVRHGVAGVLGREVDVPREDVKK